MMNTVDNIIIGAGPGGYKLAATLSARGESVVIIERNKPGGTCLNRGCIPTKCLCATAAAKLHTGDSEAIGVTVGEVSIDFAAAIAHKDKVVAGLREGIDGLLRDCTLVKGDARIIDATTVEVGDEVYRASRRLVIATGSQPAVLPVEGAALAMSSDDALSLSALPGSIIIIGGGVIGIEFASIFNALGSEVTVIEYCKEILPPFDADIAKRLRTALSKRGIRFITSAAVKSLAETADGNISVTYAGKRGDDTVVADKALMAVGRRPVIPVGAVEAGIKLTPRGFIEVDPLMQTSLDGVYAIGDVNGLSMLAHSAYAQGRVVAYNDPEMFRTDIIPSVVFSEPELAMTGSSQAMLDNAGVEYDVIKRSYAANGKACASNEAGGVVKLLCSREDHTVLGVTILGAHAADLIAEATMLVTDRVPLEQIGRRYIHAHPTLSELFV